MSDNICIFACVAVVVLGGVTSTVVHYNERKFQMQRACLDARGNWETREHSDVAGCRFPTTSKGMSGK